jgi:hypothetical protein
VALLPIYLGSTTFDSRRMGRIGLILFGHRALLDANGRTMVLSSKIFHRSRLYVDSFLSIHLDLRLPCPLIPDPDLPWFQHDLFSCAAAELHSPALEPEVRASLKSA